MMEHKIMKQRNAVSTAEWMKLRNGVPTEK